MSSTNHLQEAQDDLRSKSLDDREATLVAREKLLDDTDRLKQLKVLDERISLAKAQFTDVDKAIDDATLALEKVNKQYNNAVYLCESWQDKLSKLQSKHETIVRDFDLKIQIQQEALSSVNREIKQQKSYLVEQEKTVTDTIAEWNVRLGELHQEGNLLEERKRTLDTNLLQVTQLITTQEEVHSNLAIKIDQLQLIYDRKLTEMKQDLANVRVQVQSEENKLEDIKQEQQHIMEDVENRERTISIREAAADQQEVDLRTREQQLNLKLRLM